LAHIFKPTYTAPVPDGATITTKGGKPVARFSRGGRMIDAPLTADGQRVRLETAEWWIRFKVGREWKRVKGFTDRRATEARAVKLENRAAQEAAGIADPFADHQARPLPEHAADFIASLAAKWCPKHVAHVAASVRRITSGCGFKRIADIDGDRVEVFLADLRQGGLSVQSSNHHLAAMKQFCRWLVRSRRTAGNPLVHLDPGNVATDRRLLRRILTDEEVGRLLYQSARSDWTIRGLAGRDRAILYHLALGTGLRASEIASLVPESFDLDGGPPVVVVEARASKRRQRDEQPLGADLVEALRPYLGSQRPGERVWRAVGDGIAAKMIREDLAAARVAWIAQASDPGEREARERSDFLVKNSPR